MSQTLNISRVIAHRGASAYAPENTLASMRKAAALGAQWLEFDVMLTADGEAIIMHDDTLARTTNAGARAVAQTPYSEIALMDAGSWFGQEYAHEPVPTLVECLTLLKNLNAHINLEIKPTPGKEIATAEKSLEILQALWPVAERPPIISSQAALCLKTVFEQAPQHCLGGVVHEWCEPWQQWVEDYGCQSMSVNHLLLTPQIVGDLKKRLKYVLAYTVNDTSRAEELMAWGVDAVFSDRPDLLA